MANAREQKHMDKMLAVLARPDEDDCEGGLMLRELFTECRGSFCALGVPAEWCEYFLPMQKCVVCGTEAWRREKTKMLCCARCKVTHYCSVACQKQDWPEHKRMCAAYVASVEAAAATKCSEDGKNEYVLGAAAFVKWKGALNRLLLCSLLVTREELAERQREEVVETWHRVEEDNDGDILVKEDSVMYANMKACGAKGETFLFFRGPDGELSVAVFERRVLYEACRKLFTATPSTARWHGTSPHRCVRCTTCRTASTHSVERCRASTSSHRLEWCFMLW